MQLKRLLITTTSICVLSLMPLPAFSQDAGLTAAYNAYIEAQSGEDAEAKAAAEAAFLAECQRPTCNNASPSPPARPRSRPPLP